jgi:DUF1680 family protein
MLRLTGDSRVADEIELATLNAILGAQHPSGRWWTYNTPMDGVRKASAQEIVFQSREGSPELNCCSVNGPRGLGMLSEWAVMLAGDGVALNYYGPGSISLQMGDGAWLTLVQNTRYPQDGDVMLTVRLGQARRFNLRLRIPAWSDDTRVAVNGAELPPVLAGRYLSLEREWRDGDVVHVQLDMSPHVWLGEREAAGKASIYRGPLLLVYDRQYNTLDPDELPAVSARNIRHMLLQASNDDGPVWVQGTIDCEGPHEMVLVEFASAGAAGTPYRSWLPTLMTKHADTQDTEGVRVSSFAV